MDTCLKKMVTFAVISSLFLGYPKFNPSRANLINCPLLKYILLFNTTVQGCEVIF